jgi:uncharacterized protein (DUF1697 family)
VSTRYVALLRGINVGGHRVAMTDLRVHMEALGLSDVSTFIASGNVIFSTAKRASAATLEQRIEQHLQLILGYAVPTFVRTPAELIATSEHRPFSQADWDAPGNTVHVGFLRDVPAPALAQVLAEHQTERDLFAVHGREMYWLVRGKSLETLVNWAKLEKQLRLETTMRNRTSLAKLVAVLKKG